MYFLGGGIIVFKTIQHTLASVALIKQIAVGLVIGGHPRREDLR